ncbi:MAG: SprT-like domain-containing protein [Bdellovibrionota bacterium]
MHRDVIALTEFFRQLNDIYFDGFLDEPVIRWNTRLRVSAGRFIPGSRKFFNKFPPAIEIASYLKTEQGAVALLRDTMAHEMIHYWLWVRRRSYGHSPDFYVKLKEIGASRYNPVPRGRPYKYVYVCSACGKEFFTKKTLGSLACATCCKRHSGGKYDGRFKLYFSRNLSLDEGRGLLGKSRYI